MGRPAKRKKPFVQQCLTDHTMACLYINCINTGNCGSFAICARQLMTFFKINVKLTEPEIGGQRKACCRLLNYSLNSKPLRLQAYVVLCSCRCWSFDRMDCSWFLKLLLKALFC